MKYYFTFGSAEQFPYGRDDYVLVIGTDYQDCMTAYRTKHPDVDEGILNCAFYYKETEWEKIEPEYYAGVSPAEVIVSSNVKAVVDEVADSNMKMILNKAINICDAYDKGAIGDMLMEVVQERWGKDDN